MPSRWAAKANFTGVLIPRATLDGIRDRRVTLAFRRWSRPRVRAGTKLRTAVGLVEVVTVEEVDGFTEAEARAAGAPDRKALLAVLSGRRGARLYRIVLRYAGADPRIALRQDTAGLDAVRQRLRAIDARSRRGPWTLEVLELIDRHPATRAADLAPLLGRERLPFKADVRKLKELGLTESLERGYRLSPRGRALLAAERGTTISP
ncbi:MAG TPA: hypothetical protein VHR88_01695 [Solirubrobacteraceae bacterium]|nr:hypothetical protein [Solirubrobacteraceae bacterium]